MPQVEVDKQVNKKLVGAVAGAAAVLGLAVLAYLVLIPTPQQAAARADSLSAQYKYDEAIGTLKLAQWRAFTSGDKEKLLSRLAFLSLKTNDLTAALNYYKQEEKLLPNDTTIPGLAGDTAERLGNKAEAVRQYNLAIDAISRITNLQPLQDNRDYFRAKIQELSQ